MYRSKIKNYKNHKISKGFSFGLKTDLAVNTCNMIMLFYYSIKLSGGIVFMTKTELVSYVAETVGLTKKDVGKAVDAIFEAVEISLKKGEKVQLIGFGNFEVRERAARKGRNPQTGEEIDIAAGKSPAFTPGKSLKEAVNQ
jgi:DNA-binding protein HU-beta